MRFPNELVDLIISEGLDSCKTSISWSHINCHYRDLVRKQLGVVVVEDGSKKRHVTQRFLDYEILMTKDNTFHIATNHPQFEQLKEFITEFSSLLVVIYSDRSYNDVLASMLNDIAQTALEGTNLCIIYSNSLNFLSKLYFRELSLYRKKVKLCELHVLGNGEANKDEMCDLNTLFERTYLYKLNSIYSLDIQNTSHQFIAEDLDTIKQLNYLVYDEASSSFLSRCPKLRVIESMKFPLGDSDMSFRLPRCDSITLTHFVSGSHYPPVDGQYIRKELTLVPSLRSDDPQFSNLFFPSLRKLTLRLNDTMSHSVSFRDCNFSTLKCLDCGSSIIPWADLSSASLCLRELMITLVSEEQLHWLESCPFPLTKLSIYTPKVRFSDIPSSRSFEISPFKSSVTSLELKNLWQCYLLQKLIIPSAESTSSLTIAFDEGALMNSIASNPNLAKKCDLIHDEEYIIFKVPFMQRFRLIDMSHYEDRNLKAEHMSNVSSIDVGNSGSSTAYANVFFDINASSDMNYAVSPSEFRLNSLAGANSDMARRQSAIVFSNGTRERRASSITSTFSPPVIAPSEDPFEGDTVIFEFTENCPSVFTTNLRALESSLFSWQEVNSSRIPLLQILIQDIVAEELENFESLIPKLSSQIIEALTFPYDVRMPMMIIEKFQIVIDFSGIDFMMTEERRSVFSIDLHTYLAYKGHKVRMLTDEDNTDFKVSVLLLFETKY